MYLNLFRQSGTSKQLIINVSELSTISIIRDDVVDDHMLLLYTPGCQIGAFLLVYYGAGGQSQTVWSPI
jgi:hypothetical protein